MYTMFEKMMLVTLMTPITPQAGHPSEPKTCWGVPLLSTGTSGVSKSVQTERVAESLGIPYDSLLMSAVEKDHLMGVLMPTPTGPVVVLPSVELQTAMQHTRYILLLDELNTANADVQGAVTGPLLSRKLAGYRTPPGLRFCAAMNPAEMATNGFVLTAPLANRLMHFNFEAPPVHSFVDYMNRVPRPSLPSIIDAEQRVIDNWGKHYSEVATYICEFLTAAPTYAVDQPSPSDPNAGAAWPSYRTWEFAARTWVTARCLGFGDDIELRDMLIRGTVGEACVAPLAKFIKECDLPSPESILRRGVDISNKRLDIMHACLRSLPVYLLDQRDAQDFDALGNAAWAVVWSVVESGTPDIAAMTADRLLTMGFDFKRAPNARKPLLRLEELGLGATFSKLRRACDDMKAVSL